jgi:cytochrome c biogenesis protein CcmG/thiol:disulfide interchange protein DsbE
MKKFLPLVVIVGILVILFLNLGKDSQKLPSPFIGKPFPSLKVIDFTTDTAYQIRDNFTEWTLVNFWASWCATCRVEHPMLEKIHKTSKVQMLGINYKDTKDDANNFLTTFGNPFDKIVWDNSGKVGIELGVYAMPESFLVDNQGIIRHKLLGEITDAIWHNEFLPIINEQ